MSLDILAAHAAARPDDDAVTDGDLVLSLSELNEAVNRYGNVLRGLDVRAGEKVLWVGENSWEVVAVNHAARKVGAVCVPMKIGRATSELQSLMRISYAVFCLKKKKSTLKQLQQSHYCTHKTSIHDECLPSN